MLDHNTSAKCILHIALPAPLRHTVFEYLPPEAISDIGADHIGCRVKVPFGHQTLIGIIRGVGQSASIPTSKLRRCHALIDTTPIVPAPLLALSEWAARYYHHPYGETLFTFLPGYLREGHPAPNAQQKGWRHTTEGLGLPYEALKRSPKQQKLHQLLLDKTCIQKADLDTHDIARSVVNAMQKKGLLEETTLQHASTALSKTPDTEQILREQPLDLNQEQQSSLKQVRYHHFAVYLLEGVTGSGKTEVYLQAIAHVLQQGKQALVLVPEIGLTPQTLARFEKRFAVPVVALNSHVAKKRRAQDWLSAARGEAAIVVGTRSAASTPLPQLGIIIIDEEHDLSFKQFDGLRYSARDLAIVRAKSNKIPLLMGSATPSLESLLNTQLGRYTHLHLRQRAAGQAPELLTVDMRNTPTSEAGLSSEALEAIKETLNKGTQALVFINRRGYAPALICQQCGWAADCKACDSKMTLHQHPHQMRCHQCDARQPVPKSCPQCRSTSITPVGAGTERCEQFLNHVFSNTEIIRVDADSMSKKKAMSDLQNTLKEARPCILVGTQMLAKGHHFPNIALVVMLDMDANLFSGDFRGIERMGQLVTQVAGRAGRGETPGKVLLQTYRPDHPLLQVLMTQGYAKLAKQLLEHRALTQLPPYRFMALLRAESKRAENAAAFIKQALECAREIMPPSPDNAYIGPIPSLIEKRQDRWRFQGQICCKNRGERHKLLETLLPKVDQLPLSKRVRWAIDVDPLDFS